MYYLGCWDREILESIKRWVEEREKEREREREKEWERRKRKENDNGVGLRVSGCVREAPLLWVIGVEKQFGVVEEVEIRRRGRPPIFENKLFLKKMMVTGVCT